MRKTGVLLFCAAIALFSCSKKMDTFPEPTIYSGTYAGTFQRQTLTSSVPSQVSITFSTGGYWSGASATYRYPALCGGTFQVMGNQVDFTDTCGWTADFDWTLILNGTYEMSQYDDTLVLTRQQANNTVDIYKLKKQ